METTIMENQMENKMENEMETEQLQFGPDQPSLANVRNFHQFASAPC